MYEFKKSTSEEIEKTLCILLMAVMALIPVGSVLESHNILRAELLQNATTAEFILYIAGILMLLMLVMYFKKKDNRRLTVMDIGILAIAAALFISAIFAKNISLAVIGVWYTREGLLINLIYLIMLVSASLIQNKKYRLYLFYTLIGAGLFETFYAVMQSVFHVPFFGSYGEGEAAYRAYGTVINQDPFGALMLLFAGVLTGAALLERKIKKKILFCILTFLFLYAVLLSGTRAAMVGYIVMLPIAIGMWLVFRKRIPDTETLRLSRGKKAVMVIIFAAGAAALLILAKPVVKNIVSRSIYDVCGSIDDFGSGRIKIWADAWNTFLNDIWTGVGISNYTYASYDSVQAGDDVSFALHIAYVAHNEYLDILVNQGIIGFAAFIVLLAALFWQAYRIFANEECPYDKAVLFGCIMALIAYQVNAFFGLRVIWVTPYLYIIMGLAVPRRHQYSIVQGKKC